MQRKEKFLAMFFLILIISTPLTAVALQQKTTASSFHDEMRKLWEDHVTWTRLAIVSLAQDLPDTTTTVERLLQNQDDIGNAIKPFYGQEVALALTDLLHTHITLAADIILAAKAGDTALVNSKVAEWYANANQIAAALNSINPKNWSLDEMQAMMKEHLDLTLNEAVNYLSGDYAASVSDYEEVHAQILNMADMLSNGIMKQFPNMFRGTI